MERLPYADAVYSFKTRSKDRSLSELWHSKIPGNAASNWNLMLAGATVALIPILIAYAFGNKYFVEGLASGAVKG